MSNQGTQYKVIMMHDGSYALITEEKAVESSQETVANSYYEVRAPLFAPLVISRLMYDLAYDRALLSHSDDAPFTVPEPLPSLAVAVEAVVLKYNSYADDPTDLRPEQKQQYQTEYDKAKHQADDLRIHKKIPP